jgi:hypothetical protein
VEEWLGREIGVKVNVKEAFKINQDKMMLAKIFVESLEQKKKIMLNKRKLKERMMTKWRFDKQRRENPKEVKRGSSREEGDRGKRMKIGSKKIPINGEWFIWDERKQKFLDEGEKKRRRTGEKKYKEKVDKENGNRKRSTKGKVSTNGKVKGQKEKRKREKGE